MHGGRERDRETAEIASQPRSRGICFSTLHSERRAQGVTRMWTWGLNPTVSATVLAIVGQRLVGWCATLVRDFRPPADLRPGEYRGPTFPNRVAAGAAADACAGSGYAGARSLRADADERGLAERVVQPLRSGDRALAQLGDAPLPRRAASVRGYHDARRILRVTADEAPYERPVPLRRLHGRADYGRGVHASSRQSC